MAQVIRTRLTFQGLIYLILLCLIFLGAIMQRVNPLLLLTGLLVGPLVLSWRSVRRSLSFVQAHRKFPKEIAAGDLLVVELAAKNVGRRPCWAIRFEDQVRRLGEPVEGAPGQEVLRPEVLFSRVLGRRTEQGAFRGRLMQRGRYELGPLRATTEFPLGLIRGGKQVAGRETLLVLPRLGTLNRKWSELHREAEVGSMQTHQKHGAHEGEFFGLREWRTGDSVRWIHWRTTAKKGRLSVRQFEQPRNQDFALLVDLYRPPKPTLKDLDQVELAVSFAATVVADLFRGGGSHLLFALGGKETWMCNGPVATALVRDLMERLSLVESTSNEHRVDQLLLDAYSGIRPNMSVLLVSTRKLQLTDAARFSALWKDPVKSALASRTVCLTTSSPLFHEYFEPSTPSGTATLTASTLQTPSVAASKDSRTNGSASSNGSAFTSATSSATSGNETEQPVKGLTHRADQINDAVTTKPDAMSSKQAKGVEPATKSEAVVTNALHSS